jgi:hypothetical protein
MKSILLPKAGPAHIARRLTEVSPFVPLIPISPDLRQPTSMPPESIDEVREAPSAPPNENREQSAESGPDDDWKAKILHTEDLQSPQPTDHPDAVSDISPNPVPVNPTFAAANPIEDALAKAATGKRGGGPDEASEESSNLTVPSSDSDLSLSYSSSGEQLDGSAALDGGPSDGGAEDLSDGDVLTDSSD